MERELYRVEPQQGQPLELTLDLQRQTAAEAALAGVGPASALVAVRPSDGAILAAANGAGTDGYNLATYGQAAPGSTFKTVSSLALLRAGLKPSTVVPCTGRIVVDGKPFENYDDYPSGALGNIPLSTAVANSCNTAFISQAGKVSDGDLADAAASLGLGIDHDLGFPAYFGAVPAPKSRDRGGRRPDRPGRRPRVADGDGDRDGVDPVGQDRRTAAGEVGRRVRPGRRRSR